jgi:two-component system, cell cycle sensor histidine kinase and response regulator CckA
MLLGACAAYVAVFVGWIVQHAHENTRSFEDIGFLPLYLAAGVGVWAGSPGGASERRERAGWRLIAAAWLVSCAAAIAWVVAPASPMVDVIADALYTSYYPLMVAGFVLLCVWPTTDRGRRRLLLETSIVVVAGVTFSWYFGSAGTTSLSRLEQFVGLGELTSVGEIAVLIVASIALHGRPVASRRPALQLLTLGAFVAAVADLMLGYSDPRVDHVGRQLAVCFLAIAVLLFIAAGTVNRQTTFTTRSLSSGAWLPYSSVTVLGVLVLREVFRDPPRFELLAGLVSGGVLLTALVLVRLWYAERAVREEYQARMSQDARYRALIQGARESLLVVECGLRVRYASRATEALLGWQIDAVTGAALSALLPDAASHPLTRALGEPQDGAIVRWTHETARGRRDLESVLSDFRADPVVRGLVVNTRDVTERTALEATVRQSQKLDALGLLAGGVAHDFNNILTVIGATAEVLSSDAHAEQQHELQQITEACERGAELCRQLLAFGRADSMRRDVVDLATLSHSVIPMLQRVLPSSVRLELHAAMVPLHVRCDRVQLEIAVLNLVMNARDAMPAGGTIRIVTETRRISAEASTTAADALPSGEYAVIVVRDNGAGMDAATLARALDPFFTTKSLGKGTGLGLSTVYGVVTAAGGSVRMESAPGKGTTVTLLMPLVPAPAADDAIRPVITEARPPQRTATAEPPAAPTPVTASPRRRSPTPGTVPAVRRTPAHAQRVVPGSVVLVVDDERVLRETIATHLTSLGYLVEEAADGVEALERLNGMAVRPDAIIADITMPRMNGVALAHSIRERHAHVPIILISGFMATAAPPTAEMPLSVDMMAKPFTLAQLDTLLSSRVAAHS